MKVEVKLFANFRDYLPPGSDPYARLLDIEEGTTIQQVLQNLKVPPSMPMVFLVNGVYKPADEVLQPGDVLSVFPPVAGG